MDNFPLPIIELMVDATTGHEVLSFTDGLSGYNQIRVSPKDEECTTFCTHFQWDEGCQNAFESIKRHLLNLPVLGAPTLEKSLILYIAAQEQSIGTVHRNTHGTRRE
ncbi:UNVERIFIED_CONTAM: hypothetical protein Sangu_3071500 [Sesamum angustifolium]|uniref:Uncharacterized protein n=1 Tax=Sesamum angustifolium TaxID=2727405 RepID=A0AAW2KFM0_9LAMI